jgi:sugar lactone lactonase YvrE
MRRLTAELLLDVRCDLGEGPLWHPERDALSWVELYDGRVNWLRLDGTTERSLDVGLRVGAAVAAASGGLVLATDQGFMLAERDRAPRLIAEVENDGRDSFLNDGKCDAAGRFWAGTVGVDPTTKLAVPGAGSLYVLTTEGEVRSVLEGISLANGMDWSPDGRTFYFIDSLTWGIDAYAFDLVAGALGSPRRAVEIPRELGFADGMCVDTDGGLWTALWGVGEVHRYSPEGGLDTVVELPVSQATSCVFAGPALDVLVITTASRGMDEARRAAEPHAGSVFCCRPGQSGFPAHAWGG